MNKRIPILLGLLLTVFAVFIQIVRIDSIQFYFSRLENLAYDVQLRAKYLLHTHAFQTSVAIVDVDDKSIDREGRWPWSRAKLSKLVEALHDAGAEVIAFDVFFPAQEDNQVTQVLKGLHENNLLTPQIEPALKKIAPLFDYDKLFADNLAKHDSVIGMSFTQDEMKAGVLPAPVFALNTAAEKELDLIEAHGYIGNISVLQTAAKNGGFVNVFNDDDGIIRRVPLLIRYQDQVYPSLALEAARLFLLGKIKLITAAYGDQLDIEGVQLENHIIPTDAKAQVIVPFRGRSFSFPYFSATDVLNKKIPPNALDGKIAFIGTSAAGLGDIKATAIQNAFPGVEIQATIADGILSDHFYYRPHWALGAELLLTAVLGILFSIFFPYLGPRMLSFFIIVVPAALIAINNYLWSESGLIISILIPILLTFILALMNIIYGYLFESRRREHLKDMFGQYVPSKHIDEMLTSKGSYALHGEDRIMTVLFSDIRDFTSISEQLSASQIKDMLNEFFTPMTEVIFKFKGTIDKYVGDLIMAFWGAPLKDKYHAAHALSAALEMQQKLKKLEPEFAARGWPAIRIGIGINTGEMSVGDMGSKFRRNYTVLGDAVNLASRVEALTKYYDVGIIATENTVKDQTKFVFQFLDRVRVKGKKEPVEVYEVVCRQSELTSEVSQRLAMTRSALDFYFNRQWEQSRALFTSLNTASPGNKFYHLYLKRIQIFEKFPPSEDWDGVFTLHEK